MTRRKGRRRVTPKAEQPSPAPDHQPPDGERRRSGVTGSRARQVVLRPRWHRTLGWFGVAVGAVIAILNDIILFGVDLVLLPFGHSELYLVLGLVIAAWSGRFLGLFDRATVYR